MGVGLPRLWDTAPEGRQLRSRHKAKSLLLQRVYDFKRRFHGAVRHIVQEDHIPIPDVADDLLRNCRRIMDCPILWIH